MKRNRLDIEKRTVDAMISVYCWARHGERTTLCPECAGLLEYSLQRVNKCIFGEDKPQCKTCPVHCYSPEMKERIKKVMRFSGPKMIFHYPLLSVIHLFHRKINLNGKKTVLPRKTI
ncbi:MAG: nitrous oxide-stimulated promoter family protein [Bacteroidia bacterium]|nr:nitrous oxide-stimulated promoter family protein [Bacteroidia bacterium]